jgi:hypothetical protein
MQPRPSTHPPGTTRLRLALWLVLALLVQPVALEHHGLAVVAALEVCTADGNVLVDRDGNQVPKESSHDGCCPSADAAPPPAPLAVAAACPGEVSGAPLARASPAERWMLPLSRGPPSVS